LKIIIKKRKKKKKKKNIFFLGYSTNSPDYCVLDVTSKSIIIVRDTYFNEKFIRPNSQIVFFFFNFSNPLDKQIGDGEQHLITSSI